MMTGRIIKGVSGLYFVATRDGVYECIARGLFRQQKITPLIGDYVDILETDENNKDKKTGFLQGIHERKNELSRPRVANVDLAVIVFAAANPAINLELLDSFLISAQMQNVDIVICINKIDIADEAVSDYIKKAYSLAGYTVVCVSALENNGLDKLYEHMENKVSILAGPSGVGKSSLINAISPVQSLQTGALSLKIQRGKHTTRHAELVDIKENTYIVDSPGFTSLDISKIPSDELKNYYPDFVKYAGDCYYGDCIHVSEHDCAVKAQVGKNIDEGRYNRYVKLTTST